MLQSLVPKHYRKSPLYHVGYTLTMNIFSPVKIFPWYIIVDFTFNILWHYFFTFFSLELWSPKLALHLLCNSPWMICNMLLCCSASSRLYCCWSHLYEVIISADLFSWVLWAVLFMWDVYCDMFIARCLLCVVDCGL
jgi:hypothetical protein